MRHDYVALDWVKGEISKTLESGAAKALEAFVENMRRGLNPPALLSDPIFISAKWHLADGRVSMAQHCFAGKWKKPSPRP